MTPLKVSILVSCGVILSPYSSYPSWSQVVTLDTKRFLRRHQHQLAEMSTYSPAFSKGGDLLLYSRESGRDRVIIYSWTWQWKFFRRYPSRSRVVTLGFDTKAATILLPVVGTTKLAAEWPQIQESAWKHSVWRYDRRCIVKRKPKISALFIRSFTRQLPIEKGAFDKF